ncbi:MAG TPA: tetratricopeptide repeat protein, partial [Phaeodactylibacter sp.]|nr:tetratricopeptide repeat protein [Phaeodactylibacter sp.]
MKSTLADYLQQAQVYYQSGQWQQALEAYEQALNEQPDLLTSAQIGGTLGNIFHEQGQLQAAMLHYQRAFEQYAAVEAELNPAQRHQFATLGNNLANLLMGKQEPKQAVPFLRAAIRLYEGLAETDAQQYQPYLALTQYNLAQAAAQREDMYTWRKSIKAAMALYEELAKERPAFQPYLANAQASLAESYANEEPPMAEVYWKRAVGNYEQAAERDTSVRPFVAASYNNLGYTQKQMRAYGKSVMAYTQALEAYQQLAEENAAEYLPFLANTYNNLGILFTEMTDKDEAIGNYKRALGIYEGLAQEAPESFRPYQATILHNLGVLYDEKQEYDTALAYYDQALYERQQLAKDNPESFLPDVSATALNMATLYQSRLEQTADMAYQRKGLAILPAIEQALDQIAQERPAIVSMRSELAYYKQFFQSVKKAGLEAQLVRNQIEAWQEEQMSTLEVDEKLGFQQQIINALEDYLSAYPDADGMQEQLAIAYGHQAWLYLLEENTESALTASEKALSVWESHPSPKVNRAHALLFSGQIDAALELYHTVKDEITVEKKRIRVLI